MFRYLRYLRALWLNKTRPRHCCSCRRHYLKTGPMTEIAGIWIICRDCASRCIEIIDEHMRQQRAEKPLPTGEQLMPFRKARVDQDRAPRDVESDPAVRRDRPSLP